MPEDTVDPKQQYVVAVTGGIASGKSALTDRLAARGLPVVDADCVARELVEPGQPALEEIRTTFGDEVLDVEGRLQRRVLRERIFADPQARRRLEAILHPRIRERMHALAHAADGPCVVLAIPLLTAESRYPWIDSVVVVDVPEEVQIERLMARDGIDEAAARAALSAQISREARLALADIVVPNSAGLDALDREAEALVSRLLGRVSP
jgi:dephospho-CoA kinase